MPSSLRQFNLGVAALHVGDHEEFVIFGLAEIHPLDRARVNHRRMRALDSGPGACGCGPGRHNPGAGLCTSEPEQHQIAAQHDRALAAVAGALHRGMGGQDRRQVGVGLSSQPSTSSRQAVFQLLRRSPPGSPALSSRCAISPEREIQGRAITCSGRPSSSSGPRKAGLVQHLHVRHLQGVEVLQGVGPA